MPHRLVAVLALPLIAITVAFACGDGNGDGGTVAPAPSGSLTDPRTVPTATPWAEAPEVAFLEEGAIAPLPGEEGETGEETTGGTCDDTYVVQSGDYPGLIAEKCDVSLEDLLEANPGLDPTNLQVGQELKLPPR